MPQAVVAAVIAGTGAAITAGAVTAAAFVTAASTFVLSGLSIILSPKPKKGSGGSFSSIRSNGATQSIRQPVVEREIVYGEIRKGGNIVYAGVTDNNNYMNLIFAVASHEIESIEEVLINDYSIPKDNIDANGDVISGRYGGYINIQFGLGSDTQVANPTMISNIQEWTTDHRLQGIAYIYVRFDWNQNVFPQGAPNVSCWIKGKKLLDTRDSVERYSTNLCLITRDYLTDDLGGKVNQDFVNDTITSATANTCDEYVSVKALSKNINSLDLATNIFTLNDENLSFQTGDKVLLNGLEYYVIAYQRQDTPRIKLADSMANAFADIEVDFTTSQVGAITKIEEPRYHGGGIIKTSVEPAQNIVEMIACMMGQVVFAGGSWRIYAGEYQAPTISFNESDLISSITSNTYQPKTDRFNRVQGVYTSPDNTGNPSDYPVVTNALYEAEDNGILTRTLDQPFTQRAGQAQRVAKISLERMRQEITFEATFKLTAFKVQVGDNFYFSFDKWGWVNKVFEVIEWSLVDNGGAPAIKMLCRENASGVYDWNNGEETQVDLAPNTQLPNWSIVTVVSGFSLDSVLVSTQGDDRIYTVTASWLEHENRFVVSGGKYEIEYKESIENDFRSFGIVDGSITQISVNVLKPDTLYDIRIFAYNNLGVRSQPSTITDFVIGSTATTETEDWENETLIRDGVDWEFDTLTTEDWE